MNYYVDGEFTNDDFKFNKKDQLFSSIYSSKNSSYDYLELDLFTHQNIVNDSFKNIALFYNKYESIFKNFSSLEGFDPWFLEHFRLYFNYRNFLLKIASIKVFLSKYPDGKILTRDPKISDFIEPESVYLISNKFRKEFDFFLILYEVNKILFSKSKFFFKNDILLFKTSRSDYGSLNSVFSTFKSRNLFDKKRYDKSNYDSDYILKKYIFSKSCIKDFFNFKKAFDNLVYKLRSKSYNSNHDKLIVDFFVNNLTQYF